MMKYTFTLEHDRGTGKVSIVDETVANATKRIMDIEQCPESAIINIKIKRYGK